MIKLLLLIAIGFIIYKVFWQKPSPVPTKTDIEDENELVECSKCHTFVPKSECEISSIYGCICKDCK